MKIKLLSTVILMTVFSVTGFCQKFSIGLKAGTDLQKIKGKSFDEEFKFGYHVGAFAEIKVKKVGIQPEVYFSQVNAKNGKDASSVLSSNNVVDRKIKLSYLNVPILVNLYFNDNVALVVGPQFGVLVNQDVSGIGNVNNAFKKGDFSLTGGLQLKILKFRVYGRYVIGLNDKRDISGITDEGSWKSQVVHLGLAYSFL